jgi:hypothetical protein
MTTIEANARMTRDLKSLKVNRIERKKSKNNEGTTRYTTTNRNFEIPKPQH